MVLQRRSFLRGYQMKDRLSKYPGRVKLTPVDGQANTFDMIRADEPEDEGTPLNKNTLLKDKTAEDLGLDPAVDPTPDDALNEIMKKYYALKVGDIVETVRTDLDDRWVLCNGDIVPEGEYPELREKLFYNTDWRMFDKPDGYNTVRPTRRPGEWVFLQFGNSNKPVAYAKVYNASTETWTSVTCPSVPTDYSYGIFGLTWDGSRYIMGVMEDSSSDNYIGTMFLFTSTDLKNWTQMYSFKNSANYMQGYDLTSDGENTIVMEYGVNYSGSTSVYQKVYSVNKSMTKNTQLASSSNSSGYGGYLLTPAPDGYWARKYHVVPADGDVYGAVSLYKGNTLVMSSYQSSNDALAFFSDRYVMTVGGVRPADNYYGSFYTVVADLTAGTKKNINWIELIGVADSAYMNYCEYDKTNREWAFYLKTTSHKFYAAYISEDSDPSDSANYRVVQIEALPEREYNDQMSPDRAVMHNSVIRDPNLKYLPSHDGDTYKYIYKGDDET